jgi:hypothetical protein
MPTGVLPGSGFAPFNITSAGTPTTPAPAPAPALLNPTALIVFLALIPYFLLVVDFGISHGVSLCCTLVGLVGMAVRGYRANVPGLDGESFRACEEELADIKASRGAVKHEELRGKVARWREEEGKDMEGRE